MDLSRLSTSDLTKIASGDMKGLSTETLEMIAGSKSSPSQEEGFLEKSTRSVSRGAKNLGVGVADMGDLIANSVRGGINYVAGKLGSDYQIPTMGESLDKGIDTATSNYTAPRNDSEKVSDAALRGVGSMIGSGGLGAAIKVGKYTPSIIKGAKKFLQMGSAPTPGNIGATAASAGVTQHILNEDPENIWGALGAGIGTGVGVQGLPALRNSLSRAGKKVLDINPEKVAKIDRAGTPLTLGDVSETGGVKKLQNFIKNATLTDNKLQKNSEALEDIIRQRLGIKSDKIQPTVQTSLQSEEAIKGLEENVSNIYEKLQNKAIKELMATSETKKVPINKAASFVQDIIKNTLENEPELVKDFKRSPAGSIYSKFIEPIAERGAIGEEKKQLIKTLQSKNYDDKLINDIVAKAFPEGSNPPPSISYNPLKEIRTKTGKKGRGSFGQLSDLDEGRLEGLYGSLTKDIENQIEAVGGTKAKSQWKLANNVYARFKKKSNANLNPFLSIIKKSPNDAPYLIADDLKKNGELFRLIYPHLKKGEHPSFTSSIVNAIGEKNASFNYGKFATEINKMSPSEQGLLFKAVAKENGVKPDDIRNIVDVIDYSKDTLLHANTSQTAQHNAIYDQGKEIAKNIRKIAAGAVGGAGAMSGIKGMAAAAAGLTATWGLNKHLFANPALIRSMAYAGKMTKTQQVPIWINKLSKVPGFPEELKDNLLNLYQSEIKQGLGGTPKGLAAKSTTRSAAEINKLFSKKEDSKKN